MTDQETCLDGLGREEWVNSSGLDEVKSRVKTCTVSSGPKWVRFQLGKGYGLDRLIIFSHALPLAKCEMH